MINNLNRRRNQSFLLAIILVLSLTGAQPMASGGAVASPVAPGLPTMEHPELLPLLPPDGTETRQSSSYDPSGSNNDGNFTNAYTRYIDSNGEYVIFDVSGPGCLYRQQINVWSRGRKKEAGLSHIKYYFDGESKPRVNLTIDDLFGGKAAPFTDPFTFLDPRPRFGILYYPFVFQKLDLEVRVGIGQIRTRFDLDFA